MDSETEGSWALLGMSNKYEWSKDPRFIELTKVVFCNSPEWAANEIMTLKGSLEMILGLDFERGQTMNLDNTVFKLEAVISIAKTALGLEKSK